MKIVKFLAGSETRKSWMCLALLAMGMGAVAARFQELHMAARSTAAWVMMDAMPAVVSHHVFGHHVGYTSLKEVRNVWDKGIATNIFIEQMRQRKRNGPPMSSEYVWWGYDEKGIVDYMKLCFWLFGARLESVTLGYLLVLGLSVAVFGAAFFRSPLYLFLAATLLAGIYLLLPSIAYNPQLGSVLTTRCFPILSMIACLHGILYFLSPPKGLYQFFLLAVQIAIVQLVEHVRLTGNWQQAILGGAAVLGLLRLWQSRSQGPAASVLLWKPLLGQAAPSLLALGLILAGRLGSNAYQSAEYSAGKPQEAPGFSRSVWHCIYMGLAMNPSWAERHQLQIDDKSVMKAAGRFLVASGREQEWGPMESALFNHSEDAKVRQLQLARYDAVVREMLLAHVREHPGEALAALFYYKPLSLGSNICWLMGLRQIPPNLHIFATPEKEWYAVVTQMRECSDKLRADRRQASPWNLAALLLVVPFVALFGPIFRTGEKMTGLLACALLFAGSAVPSMVGYPAPWNSCEPFLAALTLLYFGLGWTVNSLIFRRSAVLGSV